MAVKGNERKERGRVNRERGKEVMGFVGGKRWERKKQEGSERKRGKKRRVKKGKVKEEWKREERKGEIEWREMWNRFVEACWKGEFVQWREGTCRD